MLETLALALCLEDVFGRDRFAVDPRLVGEVVGAVCEDLQWQELPSELIPTLALQRRLVGWLEGSGRAVRKRPRVQRESGCILLYQASRDGFEPAEFHRCCDNMGATVTVAKSGENVFGGYTSMSWGENMSRTDPYAWKFSLVGPNGAAIKFPVKGAGWLAIASVENYGPVFGGFQLCPKREHKKSCDFQTNIYHNMSRGGSPLTGHARFEVDDYEVFGLC